MTTRLRVIVADDERPARSYLAALLRQYEDIELVAEAADGLEAVEAIETHKPDVAILDLQMPELSGIEVVGVVKKSRLPLVIFATAHDEYAVEAFRLHAVDYLLKPVESARLREALNRAAERLERRELHEASEDVLAAAARYESVVPRPHLERVPIRRRDDVLLLPVAQIASIVADGELLHLTTHRSERYAITYRLKDLESRINGDRFIRLSRSTLVAIDAIARIQSMPGGLHRVVLHNGQQLSVSRIQSRQLRDTLLKL
jgi:two-component system, LytTR family, response regulator